ncbi:MAG: DUF3035 domain-containing protein [Paracoccaceae bacterium]
MRLPLMRARFYTLGLVLLVALLVSACANQQPRLLNVGASNSSPDEFAVLPGKPLQTPDNFGELPTPTPGAANITDPSPNADAIAALGGNPEILTRSGIPAADGALLAFIQRFGVGPNIRAELSQADLAFRRRQNGLFFMRWFAKNRYFAAYRRQSLDQYRELERLRAAGVKTPSAPPRTGR